LKAVDKMNFFKKAQKQLSGDLVKSGSIKRLLAPICNEEIAENTR